MRLIPRVFIIASIFLLLISYQNFTSVNPSDWDSTSSLKIINEMNAFQSHDKVPETLAVPQGGNDLDSVKNDWVQRQGSILLNGYDKKLEAAMNDKLNAWVQEITRKDSPQDENMSLSDDSQNTENNSQPQATTASESRKIKQNLRFSRINSLKYELGDNTCMNLTADPGNTRVDLSQTLTRNAKFGVEHRTADSKTQMFLKYEW